MKSQIIPTLDGSHTLFVPALNEHYHSTFGAIQESRHVFLEQGLLAAVKVTDGSGPLHVFEVGFGTGLNALLAALTAKALRCEVRYSAVELYPLPEEVWSQLNYPDVIGDPDAKEMFRQLHESLWEIPVRLDPAFTLTKIRGDLRSVRIPGPAFHLIFFDAFAPGVQPDLWTREVFDRMSGLLYSGGVLVTYSCKGEVRRNLMDAGFLTEKLTGPPGKREMLRARKS